MLRPFRVLCYDHFRVSQCFVIIIFHWFVGLISNFHKTIYIYIQTRSNIDSAILYSQWEIKTLYVSRRTVAHFTIFSSPIQIPFSFCSILFCIQLCKAHTTRVRMDVYTPI